MPTKKPRKCAPKAPRTLGRPGRAFWAKVLGEFNFESDHQYQLLGSALRHVGSDRRGAGRHCRKRHVDGG